MNKFCLIIILTFLNFDCQKLYAQKFSSEIKKKAAEDILNVILNSAQFDSVYTCKKVYLMANELITIDCPLKLKRKNCNVKILNESKLKGKSYIVLGDFTLNWNNLDSTFVRVQLYSSLTHTTLGLGLKKNNGSWKIINHIIFKED